jgi:hypothetical protein
MIGVCKWVNRGDVLMSFSDCKERIIPVDCLESVEGNTIVENKQTDSFVDANKGLLTFYGNSPLQENKEDEMNNRTTEVAGVKMGSLYRIVKIPDFWKEGADNGEYPDLGAVGRLISIHRSRDGYNAGTLKLSGGTQRYVPFACMEEVKILIPPPPVMDLADDKLLDAILVNPGGALKLMKGLARMNKDPRAVAFVQRGMLI